MHKKTEPLERSTPSMTPLANILKETYGAHQEILEESRESHTAEANHQNIIETEFILAEILKLAAFLPLEDPGDESGFKALRAVVGQL